MAEKQIERENKKKKKENIPYMSQAQNVSKINAKRPLNKNFKANIYWEGQKWKKRVNEKPPKKSHAINAVLIKPGKQQNQKKKLY